MAFSAGEIVGKVKADFRDFKDGMKQVKQVGTSSLNAVKSSANSLNSKIKNMTPQLRKAAAGLTAMGAAAGILAKNLAETASDYDEALNKTGLAFGELTDDMIAQSETAAQTMGMSKKAYLESTSTIGLMLKSMKLTTEEAKTQASTYAQLAADMGSAFNEEPVAVMEAFQSAIAGSTEPLRKFGVVITESRLQQEALNLGLVEGKGQLDSYTRSMALQSIIMQDTAAVQGDFMKTSDGMANAQRILSAEFENLKIAIGQSIVPIFQVLQQASIDVLNWFKQLSPETQKYIGISIALGAVLGLVTGPIMLLITLIPSLSAGFVALGAVIHGIGAPILALVAMLGALFLAWQTNFLGIRDLTNTVFEEIKALVQLFIFAWETDMFSIQSITTNVWTAIRTFFEVWWQNMQELFGIGLNLLTGNWKLAFDGIKNVAKATFDGVVKIGKKFFELVQDMFIEGAEIINEVWGVVMGGIQNTTSSVFESVKQTLKNAINWMITKLNAFISAINSVARYIPGLSRGDDEPRLLSEIPLLAKGGIVTGPTLAVIGEAGPEAVVPLSRMNDFGGGGGNHYHFDGAVIASKENVMEIFEDAAHSMRPNLGV